MSKTAKEAAEWMYNEIKSTGVLYQSDAAQEIYDNYGEEHTYENENGNLAISKEVLAEFKKLHGGRAKWQRSDFCWEWE